MSYSIIFETKIVLLSDGRLIHFSRQGCNNDNAGRHKDEFEAQIHTREDFVHIAEGYKSHSKPFSKEDGNWDLKVGSAYATYHDYGEHLLRMLKRALPYGEFIKKYHVYATLLVGVHVKKPIDRMMTPKEFSEQFYDLLYSGNGMTYQRLYEYPDTSDERSIVDLIEKGSPIQFEILKHKKFNLEA